MSSKTPTQSALTSGVDQILRSRDGVRYLPEPGEHWCIHDVPQDLAKHLQTLQSYGVIESTGRVKGSDKNLRTYQTDAQAYRYVQTLIQRGYFDHPGPCNHSGVRNLGNGRYTCTDDDCTETFDRDIAQARMG